MIVTSIASRAQLSRAVFQMSTRDNAFTVKCRNIAFGALLAAALIIPSLMLGAR